MKKNRYNKVKLAVISASLLTTSITSQATELLTHVPSQHSVQKTADNFAMTIKAKGLNLFNRINHTQNAKNVGMKIRPSEVIIFGNPKLGTKLMQCEQAIAIDLPLKVHIWQDKQGKVWLSYLDAKQLKSRHNVQGCDKFFNKMNGVLPALANKATS